MKRLFAVALVVSLGQSSIAFAAGPIAASAAKASTKTTATAQTGNASPAGFASFAAAAHVGSAPAVVGVFAQQGGTGTISQTGITKRTKLLIFSGVAAAFVGIAYGIDHRVKDVTPSSLGTREDNSVFGK